VLLVLLVLLVPFAVPIAVVVSSVLGGDRGGRRRGRWLLLRRRRRWGSAGEGAVREALDLLPDRLGDGGVADRAPKRREPPCGLAAVIRRDGGGDGVALSCQPFRDRAVEAL
jgi:hypothetical protein